MTRQQLIEWLDRITAELQRAMAYDAIFSEVQTMVRGNDRFRNLPGRFTRTLFEWFTQVAASTVRRQLKDEDHSISLVRFLRRVHEHPGLVSREHMLGLFADDLLRDRARHSFNRYCGRRGKYRKRIRREVVGRDIRALRQPQFRRLEEWVDRFVAHTDRRGMQLPAPRLADLRSCLRTLDRIVQRYRLLLKGVGGTVRPEILDPWTEVFTFAWIPGRR